MALNNSVKDIKNIATSLNKENNYKARKTAGSIAVSIVRLIFLIAFSYILLYPFAYMISHAFRAPANNFDPTIEWVPKYFSIEPFKVAFSCLEFGSSIWNTFLAEVISTGISVISCGFAAYGMARYKFKGRNLMQFMLIISILLPASMIIIPNYINYRNFDILGVLNLIGNLIGKDIRINLLETVWAFWLPALLGVSLKSGFLIYIYIQFYKGLPKELEEAAWVDGASPLKTYLRIVFPSSGVAITTVTVFSLIWNWNDYYSALMYWQANPTLAVKLSSFTNYAKQFDTRVALADSTLAACLLFVLPLLIFYMIMQKRFIASIASTGIVG